jgi:replication factor A1
MAQIKDLEVRQGDVDIVVEVVEKGEIREFQKFGKTGRVCNAKIKDETGEMNLTLWNEQIDQVNAGDKVHITNGYVNEFQGEKQLTTGKFGKLEVVEKGEGKEVPPTQPQTSEEIPAEETAAEEKPTTEEESIEEEKVE